MDMIKQIFNFDDIGTKIKELVKWSCWISILLLWIATPILIVVAIAGGGSGAWISIIVLPIAAMITSFSIWIGSWMTYAFGELVEKACSSNDKLSAIARPVINEENRARREADERARIEDKERIKHAGEEFVKRKALEHSKHEEEKRAKRETEEKAKHEDEKKAESIIPKKEKTLSEKLEYALRYTTDEGMIRYLRDIDDALVADILKEPEHLIRGLVEKALLEM